MVWSMSLVSWSQLSQLCPFPDSWPPLAYLLGVQSKNREGLDAMPSSAQQCVKHRCVTRAVLGTDRQHGTIWAAMKKMSSLPAKPSTTVYTRQPVGFLIFLKLFHAVVIKKLMIVLL